MAKTKASALVAQAAAKSVAAKAKAKAVVRKNKSPREKGGRAKAKARNVSKRPASKSKKASPAENPFDDSPPPGQRTLAVLPDDVGSDPSSKPKRAAKVVLGPVHEVQTVESPPSPAPAGAAMASFFEMCEDDNLPPSPERPHVFRHDAARSREEVFSFPMRNVQRIHEHFGLDPLTRLSSNLSSLSVLSLYSGLGGAEIATALTTTNLREYVEKKGLNAEVGFPKKPKNLLACDSDQDCQKILKSHTESKAKLFFVYFLTPCLCANFSEQSRVVSFFSSGFTWGHGPGVSQLRCSKDPPKFLIPSLEDFLKEGCAAELQSLIEAKKQDCAALYKRMTTTPEKALAKAQAKAKSKSSRKTTTGKTEPGVSPNDRSTQSSSQRITGCQEKDG